LHGRLLARVEQLTQPTPSRWLAWVNGMCGLTQLQDWRWGELYACLVRWFGGRRAARTPKAAGKHSSPALRSLPAPASASRERAGTTSLLCLTPLDYFILYQVQSVYGRTDVLKQRVPAVWTLYLLPLPTPAAGAQSGIHNQPWWYSLQNDLGESRRSAVSRRGKNPQAWPTDSKKNTRKNQI